jgi:hypothetical protein
LIGEDGRVYEGRGWDKVGAHTLGWSKVSVSFAFMGNFEEKEAKYLLSQDKTVHVTMANTLCKNEIK